MQGWKNLSPACCIPGACGDMVEPFDLSAVGQRLPCLPCTAAVADRENVRCGWMMQVLQCGAPADGVEGRG